MPVDPAVIGRRTGVGRIGSGDRLGSDDLALDVRSRRLHIECERFRWDSGGSGGESGPRCPVRATKPGFTVTPINHHEVPVTVARPGVHPALGSGLVVRP